MSTQEERRQAIGNSLTAERQAIGQRIRDDLNRSLMPERKQKTLEVLPLRGGLPVQVGVGEWRGSGVATGGGGGIAGPLSEVEGERVYHPEKLVQSSDGLVYFKVSRVKSVKMLDANGATVVMEFADVS